MQKCTNARKTIALMSNYSHTRLIPDLNRYNYGILITARYSQRHMCQDMYECVCEVRVCLSTKPSGVAGCVRLNLCNKLRQR